MVERKPALWGPDRRSGAADFTALPGFARPCDELRFFPDPKIAAEAQPDGRRGGAELRAHAIQRATQQGVAAADFFREKNVVAIVLGDVGAIAEHRPGA